jgi:hypothetical protein
MNRFQEALDVQDACNLLAIARAFVEVCDDAMAEHRNTGKVWSDPAVGLVANKIESLTHSEANFGRA